MNVSLKRQQKNKHKNLTACFPFMSRSSDLKNLAVRINPRNWSRGHSSITSAKKWVGGVRKWQFLLIYSTIYADLGGWVGLKKPKTC